ncbi:3'-5' exonuclease [Kribbella solani]|uniref:DNA 3'-5' helicase n=1 Tax=Kribbella solani TaxID=236067 RepID=A0A841DWD5_9ACTN|nr:superfamily I DNA/RNA helicase [Kribbella solani]
MRILPPVIPTAEQLSILAEHRPGHVLIKGAAGSGKTTTALLRLEHLTQQWLSRRGRLGLHDPVRVLVLTYNRTLEGYIWELARQKVPDTPGLILEVSTFGKWARSLVDVEAANELDPDTAQVQLKRLARKLPLDTNFVVDEVEYLLGRFAPGEHDEYLTVRRDGRGTSPRIERPMKERLLAEVVEPYLDHKQQHGLMDWNDLAAEVIDTAPDVRWDVAIIDEAQDFSANQVRAVLTRLAEPFSLTFVMDATQRIYPRFFTWKEAGVDKFTKVHTLKTNYRNTRQIAAFARSLVEDLSVDENGALPDFDACKTNGALPVLVPGRYSTQVNYALKRLCGIDLENDSVVFLKPKGGAWFAELKKRLTEEGVDYEVLTRSSTWPTGSKTVALCTLHSVKGLEFDHVFMLGLNQEVTPHGNEDGDAHLEALQRLIAMGVGRARKSVVVGYKPDDPSTIVDLFDPSTYEVVRP